MNNKISKKVLREFGLIVGLILPLFFGWLIPYLLEHSFRKWTLFISIPLLFFAIFSPKRLEIIYKKWISFGNILAHINSYLILGILYFLVMVPMAIIMKIVKYDPLKRRKNSKLTYKEFRNYSKVDIENIF